ncbi:LysM peptidoglycan-binding domain-containing protein [Ornithobacterium rhinotracheale]|uniref:Peptidoglycan hydrolase n=1 Tax=Ornithobacterium rhinotracheale TaxID=28251 RepID=A0A3R5UQS2_ORNRH|nr:glucosaminidase domain-containing protein [Ornithobacterium rhinotracheale]QAR30025.1 LysM peptidoglycan-binding domain-containing protein [Ornithobacterium rhinotracheale]
MKKLFVALTLAALSATGFAQDRDVEYVKKYALLAVQEMDQYKIPASITLAQGIIETAGGQSRLAEQAFNHFGIKCKENWTGGKIYHDDDARGECFRKYEKVEDSYRDHSKFLAERPYYKKLFDLALTDYRGWAHGLRKAGYATNPRYAQMLISKIEKLNLDAFDKLSPNEEEVYTQLVSLYGNADKSAMLGLNDVVKEPIKEIKIAHNEPKPSQEAQREKQKVQQLAERKNTPAAPKVQKAKLNKSRIKRHANRKEYIVVNSGETIFQIAKAYNISERRLLKYNDLTAPNKLRTGQNLFLASKRNRGMQETYRVQKGDDMYLISQKMGIKLKSLYRRNRMEQGQEPQVGEILYLRGRKPRN